MGSTNIKLTNQALELALAKIPAEFRQRLVKSYLETKSALAEARFDLCGLRGGKFLIRYLQQALSGTFTPFGQKISNFKLECDRLEQLPKTAGSESMRVLIPRALSFAYTLRNKRDIGHVGGDVDANEIDALTAARIIDWSLCELLRVVHALSLEDAQSLIDSIAERRLPVVWTIQGKKRILQGGLDYQAQVLLLLYSSQTTGVPIEDLSSWIEHPRFRDFRRVTVAAMHRERLVEWDEDTDVVLISPKGVKLVEETLLPRLGAV